jgi:DNA primase
VVVEDIPSALKLGALGYRAVALNGTHLTDEAVSELDKNATSVIWALDKDALRKAMALDKKYRLLFNSTTVLVLHKDFKDQTCKEVDECLSEIYSALS